MKKFHSVLSVFLAVVLVALFCVNSVPAYASDTISEFDFSAADTLDTYDSYSKKVSEDGFSYVETTLLNRIDTRSKFGFADYRYGAYLRDSEDRHYYSVFSLDYGGQISSNVLTIYADPDVHFSIVDTDGVRVADYTGQYDVSKVVKYKKSTDFGHNVFYIQFKAMPSGQSRLMIEFSTDSNSVQPHYSFWFGHPLTRTGREYIYANGGEIFVCANKPNTTGPRVPIYCSKMPEDSWVTSIEVYKTREEDKAWLSSASFTVFTPGKTTSNLSNSTTPASVVFNYDVYHYSANPARGTYEFQLIKATWNSKLSGPAAYFYYAKAYVNYLYAFGA